MMLLISTNNYALMPEINSLPNAFCIRSSCSFLELLQDRNAHNLHNLDWSVNHLNL